MAILLRKDRGSLVRIEAQRTNLTIVPLLNRKLATTDNLALWLADCTRIGRSTRSMYRRSDVIKRNVQDMTLTPKAGATRADGVSR